MTTYTLQKCTYIYVKSNSYLDSPYYDEQQFNKREDSLENKIH